MVVVNDSGPVRSYKKLFQVVHLAQETFTKLNHVLRFPVTQALTASSLTGVIGLSAHQNVDKVSRFDSERYFRQLNQVELDVMVNFSRFKDARDVKRAQLATTTLTVNGVSGQIGPHVKRLSTVVSASERALETLQCNQKDEVSFVIPCQPKRLFPTPHAPSRAQFKVSASMASGVYGHHGASAL